jgi:multidrug efflux pump subunit AcrA (membrane-fusion protein)
MTARFLKRVLTILFVPLLLLCGAFAERRFGSHAQARPVRASPGPVDDKLIAEGVVAAIDGVSELRARTDGRVRGVRVREGDFVTAGQVLAEIDAGDLLLQSELAQADLRALEAREQALRNGSRAEDVARSAAEVDAAQVAVTLADDRVRRTNMLFDNGAAAESVVFEAKQALGIARARAHQARAQYELLVSGSRREEVRASRESTQAARTRVAQAELHYSWSRIVAPSGGVIVGRHVDDGDTVFAGPVGTLLFEIADPTRTELLVEVDEADVGKVEPELRVLVSRPGGQQHITTGVVDRIGSRLRERTIGATSARLRAQTSVRPIWVRWVGSSDLTLPLGMRVEAAIELPPKSVEVRVPRAAVQVRDGAATLRVPGMFFSKEVNVQLGLADDRNVDLGAVDQSVDERDGASGVREDLAPFRKRPCSYSKRLACGLSVEARPGTRDPRSRRQRTDPCVRVRPDPSKAAGCARRDNDSVQP